MKGLLIKDLKLMKMQKNFFFMLLLLAVGTAVLTKNVSFILGYITLILPMFASGTVSYDDFDNGNAFLFTLPISRSLYVIEKYVFALLLGISALLAAILLTGAVGAFQEGLVWRDFWLSVPAVFSAMLLMQAVMLPVQIKFGAEKGRIAMIAIVGGLFAVGFAAVKLLQAIGIDVTVFWEALQETKPGILLAGLFVVACLAFALSARISIVIMQKKVK